MDLRNLNTFIQVAELSSFTKAAEKLGYSQPTVSFQIKQLESELGEQLFERIGHTVVLTDRGHDALAYAQNICRMTSEMISGSDERYAAMGDIRIAMADSLCSYIMTDEFSQFHKKYPGISVKVITAGTDELYRLVDHNEVDIVCTLDSRIYNTSYVIANEEKIGAGVVVSCDDPLAKKKKVVVSDIVDKPFILTEKGMSYRRLFDERLAEYNIEILPILELGRADLISELVENGVGLSFLPDYVTEEAVKRGSIVRLKVDGLEIDLWKQLLYHRDKWMSPQMQATISHLSDIILTK